MKMPRPVMVHSGTSSRIPIAIPIRNRTISAPSGLQLMQIRYQEQMLLEKEKKMLEFHRQQQDRILHRVRQRYHQRTGPVREFFEERRNLRKQNGFVANAGDNLTHDQFSGDNVVNLNDRKTFLHDRTRSVGRDRSNLLAPLNDPRYPAPPSTKKSKIVRAYVPGTVVDSPDSKQNLVGSKPLQKEESGDEGYNSAQSGKKAAKTPNGYQAWMEKQAKARELKDKRQALAKQREESPQHETTNEDENESSNVSGFRKWQLDQLKAREERLKQYNEKHPQAAEHQSEQAKNKAVKQREIELQNLIRQKEQELVEMAQRRQLQNKNSPPGKKTPVIREAKDKSRPTSGKHFAPHSPPDRKQTSPQSPPHLNTDTLQPAPLSSSNTRIVSPYAPASDSKPPLPKSLRPPPKLHRRKVDPDQPVAVNENTSFYIQKAAEAEATAVQLDLVECPACGRKFAADRLSKHTKACTGMKNRKVFDPVKMRTDGTEMQKYVQYERKASKTSKQQQPQQQKQQKSSWRAKHQDFIRTIRYAKQVSAIEAQGGSLADLPPPPPSDTSDFKQCPHCQRRFNPRAAERHIPKCKDIKSRPPPFRRGI